LGLGRAGSSIEERGERAGENGRKERKERAGFVFFYLMKCYSSFSFVKSYCTTLAI
jgi:hypothetical protein